MLHALDSIEVKVELKKSRTIIMITTEYAECDMQLLWMQYLTPQQLRPLAVPQRCSRRHDVTEFAIHMFHLGL